MTARQYKTHKGLTNESLRDNMSDLELALSTLMRRRPPKSSGSPTP